MCLILGSLVQYLKGNYSVDNVISIEQMGVDADSYGLLIARSLPCSLMGSDACFDLPSRMVIYSPAQMQVKEYTRIFLHRTGIPYFRSDGAGI